MASISQITNCFKLALDASGLEQADKDRLAAEAEGRYAAYLDQARQGESELAEQDAAGLAEFDRREIGRLAVTEGYAAQQYGEYIARYFELPQSVVGGKIFVNAALRGYLKRLAERIALADDVERNNEASGHILAEGEKRLPEKTKKNIERLSKPPKVKAAKTPPAPTVAKLPAGSEAIDEKERPAEGLAEAPVPETPREKAKKLVEKELAGSFDGWGYLDKMYSRFANLLKDVDGAYESWRRSGKALSTEVYDENLAKAPEYAISKRISALNNEKSKTVAKMKGYHGYGPQAALENRASEKAWLERMNARISRLQKELDRRAKLKSEAEAQPETPAEKPTGKKAGQRAALLAAGHTAEQIDAMPPREFGKALLDAEQKAKKEASLQAEVPVPQLEPVEPTKREWSSLKKAMISKGKNDFRFFIIQEYPGKAKGWVDSGLYKDWYAQYGRDAKREPKASQEHPSRGSLGRIGLIPSGSGQPTVSKPPQYSISASVLPDERADRLAEEGTFSSPDEAVNHLAAEFGPGIRDMAANGTLVFGHGKAQWEDAIHANAARYAFDPAMPSVEEQLATLREHPDAEEMTLGGKVYFDLAAMPKDRLKTVALHSIGEHFSLERLLGAKGYSNLLDQVEILAQVKGSTEEWIWTIVARDYGHLKPGESGVRGERDRRAFIAEVIAKLGEYSPNLPWYKRLLVKFKAWLASKGFLPMVRRLSGAEMHDLLAASLRAAAREASRAARYAPLQVPEEPPAAVTYSFGGERAALDEGQKAALEKAKALEAEGMSQRTVWNETGWFRAPWDAGNWFTDAPLAKYSADGVPMGLPRDAETKLAQSREALSEVDRAAQFPLDSLRDMLLKEGIDPGKNFQNLIAETGGGPLYSLPINPAEVEKHYAERADGVIKGFRRFLHQALNPLGSLPNEVGFLKLRYPTQGEIGRVSEMSRALFDAFEDVGDHAPSILKFLLTQNASPSMIKDDAFRKKAVWAKGLIIEMGEKLVKQRVIREETFNARKGAYLPQLYLRSLLSDAEWAGQGFGSGKRPSNMSAAMWRKYEWSLGDDGSVVVRDRETGEQVPEDVILALGPIANPGFLLSKAYGVNMRDAAILEWLEQISKNREWTLPESLVEWGGEPEKLEADRAQAKALVDEIRATQKEIRDRIKNPEVMKGEDSPTIAALEALIEVRKAQLAEVRKARKEHAPWKVTPFWLMGEADRIQAQAEHYSGDDKVKALDLAERMRAAGLKGKKAMESKMEEGREIEGFPDKWRIMPDVKRYGRLRGLAVRREIYDDIVGYTQINTGDTSMAEKILGDGGLMARYVQWWKWAKVAANPPAQLRNFITNAIMLHLSGVPFHKVPQRLIQAFEEVRANGKHWQAVKRWGGTEATFAAKELPRIDTEMLALLSKEKGLYSWDRAREIWAKMVNTTGDWYQMAEAVSKTAKYIDEIEKGTSESDAMILAHKWLLDYSLVQPSVRYLRNAPIGAPFLTFAIKVLPLMLEVATTHPLRFAPYAALPYIMTQIVASMNDVDDDDVEELKQTLPEMIRKKGHTFILPFKDTNGHWGAMDYSVFFPWTQWLDLAASAVHGEVGDVFSSSGLVSGPLVSLIAAAKTGIDPFTKQPIIDERDSPPRQVAALMNYLWSMNLPTWLTSTGWAGHMVGILEGVVDKRTGEPKETVSEAGLRLFGINVTPFNPAESRRKSIAQMEFDISDIKRRRSSLLKDKNLSKEEADEIRKDYGEMLKQRMLEMHEYKRGSEVNPKLL